MIDQDGYTQLPPTAREVLFEYDRNGELFPYPPDLHQAPCRCLFPPTMEARFAQGNFQPPGQDPA